MFEAIAEIKNRDGIHCRPSTTIIKAMSDYPGTICITGDRGETTLRSVMGLMTLALLPGEKVTITVTGPEEEQTAAKVVALFETHFDFSAQGNGTQSFLQKLMGRP